MKSILRAVIRAALLAAVLFPSATPVSAEGLPSASLKSWLTNAVHDGRSGSFIGTNFAGAHGGSLPFQVFVPAPSTAAARPPLLVFLHGSGELGNDNLQQVPHVPAVFVSSENQARHPCFILAPQCPTNDSWSNFPEFPANARAAAEPTTSTRLVLELVEAFVRAGLVDPARVYITGISLGGEGTFDMVSRRPELFAAAVPVCGIGDASRAAQMKRVPFWVFHGDQDPINPVRFSREPVEAMKAQGGTPRYTEYPGMGHEIWVRAYAEPGLVEWVFEQRR
ncbi:MAG: prolyl oligopeptidase family serine peptidase [Verrucomicrobiota bacterium]